MKFGNLVEICLWPRLAVKGLINELTLDPKKPHFILVGRHARLSKVDSTVHAISADSKHLDEPYAG